MELRKENVQMLRVKSRAASQVTFDMDYNVPDARPDVARMIQNKGDVSLDEVRLGDEKAWIGGNLRVELLYVGEERNQIASLTAVLPLEETLNLEGIADGDKMCLKWDVEDLSVHIINSRKLSIKAIVTFQAVVDECASIALPVETEEEGISVKKSRLRLMSLMVHKKDTLRIKDEYTLAGDRPNVRTLLWSSIQVRGLDLRPEENVVKARGELAVFALYVGEDGENPPTWVEYTLPFEGEVECGGCSGEMIPWIETSVIHRSLEVKPDADGEERILVADAVLELDMKLYREEEHEIILDVYTPEKEYVPQLQEQTLHSLLVRNFSKCRVSTRIPVKETLGKLLQLCHSQGRVKIDKSEIVENGIRVEGVVLLKILYIVGNDEMPFYSMEAMLPFTHVVEARGITPGCVYRLQADLEQLSTSQATGSEIEVKAAVSLGVLVQEALTLPLIGSVEEEPLDMEKIRSMPGITVYVVRGEDTLWDVARRFYTTTDEIRALNGLPDDALTPGQPLLLVKHVR